MIQNELFLHYTNQTMQNGIYTWQTPKTVILGAKDTRLSKLHSGLNYLEKNGYDLFLRSAGGLAVVSDPGILNISYFHYSQASFSINSAYQIMTKLIQNIWPQAKILPGEIKNAYCPGKFDLSINNFKIAGLSQKRYQNATAIMAYISLTGNQYQRGLDIANFYSSAQANQTFPKIDPKCMKNISDFNLDPLIWKQNLPITEEINNTSFSTWTKQHLDLINQIQTKIARKQLIIRK